MNKALVFLVLKSLGLSFIISVFAAFYYSDWYCSISSKPYVARTYEYNSECSSMTTGLAPMSRAFMILLPVLFIIFFVLFRFLKGKAANIAGKVALAVFAIGMGIVLFSLGLLRFPL